MELSEQDCAALLQLLKSRDFLSVHLGQQDGEYVTAEWLEQELERRLESSGGRVAVCSVARLVDGSVARQAADGAAQALLERRADIRMVHGDLVADRWVRKMVQEVNERLEGHWSGMTEVKQIASLWDIDVAFTLHRLEDAAASGCLRGFVEAGRVYTAAYAEGEAKVVLLSVVKPATLDSLAKAHRQPVAAFRRAASALAGRGELQGTLQGSTYCPAVFEAEREKAVQDFYDQNGWVMFDWMRNEWHITHPTQWVCDRYGARAVLPPPKGKQGRKRGSARKASTGESQEGSGIVLCTCAAKETFLSGVAAQLEAACSEPGAAVDVTELLPPQFSKDDAVAVVNNWIPGQLDGVGSEVHILNDVWVVSNTTIGRILERVKADAPAAVKELLAAAASGRSGGAGSAPPAAAAAPERKRRGSRREEAPECSRAPPAAALINRDAVLRVIRESLKCPGPQSCSAALSEAVYEMAEGELVRIYEGIRDELLMDDSQRLRKQQQQLELQLQRQWHAVVLDCRAAEKCRSHEALGCVADPLAKHLRETVVLALLRTLVQIVAHQAGDPDVAVAEASEQQLLAIARGLPEGHRGPLLGLLDAAGKLPLAEFVARLEGDAGSLGVFLRAPRQKEERELRLRHAAALRRALAEADLPPDGILARWGELLAVMLWELCKPQGPLLSSLPHAAAGAVLEHLSPALVQSANPAAPRMLVLLRECREAADACAAARSADRRALAERLGELRQLALRAQEAAD